MGEVLERVALGFAAIVGYGFVASGEADWLEGQESNSFWIVEGELDDSSDLLVVNAVDDGDDRNDFDSGAMQVVDRFKFYVEQVTDGAVRVGCVADSVELQIGVTHSRFGCLLANSKLFANSIPLVAACTLLYPTLRA